MNSPADALSFSLKSSGSFVELFAKDLTPAGMTHRTSPAANCAAWIIGHLLLVERNLHRALGVTSPAIAAEYESRFARDAAAAAATDFGDTGTLVQEFLEHRRLSVEAVTRMTPAQLSVEPPNKSPRWKNVGELVAFLANHTSMHAGQLTLIRRSLGMPPVI